jgi:hypothetical protein
MLPFLKNNDIGIDVGPVGIKQHTNDEKMYSTLDAVADDLLSALDRKDRRLLRSALEALCQHIQSMDESQDQSMIRR